MQNPEKDRLPFILSLLERHLPRFTGSPDYGPFDNRLIYIIIALVCLGALLLFFLR